MGAVIAFIFGLIVLGFSISLIKWTYRVFAKGLKIITPIALLAVYAWALMEYTTIILWATGGILALILAATTFHLHEISKIKQQILPPLKRNDLSRLRKYYCAYEDREKNMAIDIIIKAKLPNSYSAVDSLFLGDLLEVFKENLNSKTGECLMERDDFESYFEAVWEGRINKGIVGFAKDIIPERFELDSIEFPNQKNKKETTRLIKIKIRRESDLFQDAIDLD